MSTLIPKDFISDCSESVSGGNHTHTHTHTTTITTITTITTKHKTKLWKWMDYCLEGSDPVSIFCKGFTKDPSSPAQPCPRSCLGSMQVFSLLSFSSVVIPPLSWLWTDSSEISCF